MLTRLSIRDVVLIEALDLDFADGLTALTGETGAGKSILLDALGLALGDRADSGLVRKGAVQASVAANFAGFADGPSAANIGETGFWVSAVGVPLGVIGLLAGLRLVRHATAQAVASGTDAP